MPPFNNVYENGSLHPDCSHQLKSSSLIGSGDTEDTFLLVSINDSIIDRLQYEDPDEKK